MKILLATTTLPDKTGTYTVLKNIAPLLMNNHHVSILTTEGETDVKCNDLIQLPSSSIFKYSYMPELKKLIDKKFFDSYDLIHVFEYPTFIADCITMNKNKILPPLIISAHGTIHQHTNFPYDILKKIHNFIMLRYKNRVAFFIASTNAEKNHLVKKGISPQKIRVLPLGVTVPKIERTKNTKKKIVYIGRLTVTKNIDILIKAFSLIESKDVDLIIAGPDYGMLDSLKKLVKELKLEGKVFFQGRISEQQKYQMLSEATIFVHPSLEDIFSLSLIEAAAMGAPSIAFDVEANSEILENNSGLIVKGYDSESLAKSIIFLLNNDEERNKISKNAIISINQKYNWANTVKLLEQCYSEIKKQ